MSGAVEQLSSALLVRASWLELAAVLAELDRPVEALNAYGKAIDADPRFGPAYRPVIQFALQQDALDLVHSWCEGAV